MPTTNVELMYVFHIWNNYNDLTCANSENMSGVKPFTPSVLFKFD